MKNPRPGKRPGNRYAREIARLLRDGVQFHREGRWQRAEACYQQALRLDPRQPDALHLTGLIAHHRGDSARAESLIGAAIAADPDQTSYANSLGVVLLERGAVDAAIAALQQAIARDPAYPEAYNNLGNAWQRRRQWVEAIASYRQAISLRADYAEAHANQGRALHLADQPGEAVGCFEQALRLRPDYTKVARWLGDSLADLGRRSEAEAAYRRALDLDAEDAETYAALAALLERSNRLEEAIAAADAALRRDPRAVRALLAAARAERRLGRMEAALSRLQQAPIDDGIDPDARAMLAFERGMTLDREGDYAGAYTAFVRANALMEDAWPLAAADRSFFPDLIERLSARFTLPWVAGWSPPPPPDAAPAPVFLIGFPRSGTTLLDQILDAHPMLSTLEEKDAIDVIRREVDALPAGYPDALGSFDAEVIIRLRRRYRQEVRRHLGGEPAGRVVDKMPLNTIDAGLILRLFPDAQFILALRHPCDVILSGFMQAFKPNAAMVHFGSLAGAASFYAQVMALWQQYVRVLAPRVLPVRYEDLIGDLPGETRRILSFLDLPWDDAVLGYRERAQTRAIATPSYHQVVQPIYRRSIDRWRNYADAFAPLLPTLAPFIEAFGYGGDGDGLSTATSS